MINALEEQIVNWLRDFQPDDDLRAAVLSVVEYVMRRQALEEELQRLGPPTDPRPDQAEALLRDFARYWDAEPAAAERRKLLAALFDRVWADGRRIVAVKPREPFRPYFETARALKHERGAISGSDGGQTRDWHPVEIRA